MTPAQAKAKLEKQGITLKQWAKENNIDYRSAQEVLTGVKKGKFGKAHDAAVALGLKEAA